MRRTVILTGFLAACLAFTGLLPQNAPAYAQGDPNACRVMVDLVIDEATAACSSISGDSICAAHGTVSMMDESDTATALDSGKTMSLDAVKMLVTTSANPESGEWGVTMLSLRANLPDLAQPIRAILFGEAAATSLVRKDIDSLPTLTVKTIDEIPVLLRAGASGNFPQVTRLVQGKTGIADGRNAKGNWIRVRYEDVVGWALVNQVTLEGDPMTLTEFDDRDINPWWLFPAPMQAIQLKAPIPTGKVACAEAANGLLLQRKEEAENAEPAKFLVNGTQIALTNGTVLLRAAEQDHLEVMAISGGVTVSAFGSTSEIGGGEMLRVRLGGADGLTAIAAPKQKTPLPFASIYGVPLSLLPENAQCMAGIIQGDKAATVRSGPSAKNFTSLFYTQPTTTYAVVGFNTDDEGNQWWKLNNDKNAENWVEAALVRTNGACEALSKVEPGEFGGGAADSGGVPGGGGFAPSTRTIWNAEVGTDQLVGTCKLGALNYCAHLVAISPRGSGLSYKGQEIQPYFLQRVQENVYVYNGRNGIGNGKIKIVLSFTSPTTFTLTQTLVLDADPECQHINVANATLR